MADIKFSRPVKNGGSCNLCAEDPVVVITLGSQASRLCHDHLIQLVDKAATVLSAYIDHLEAA